MKNLEATQSAEVLTLEDFLRMEKMLDFFRETYAEKTLKEKMKLVPIESCGFLFGFENKDWPLWRGTTVFPCWRLSRMMVIKLIDELIYCGIVSYDKKIKKRTMKGRIFPGGNASDYSWIDAELKKRGIHPVIWKYHAYGRIYLFRAEDIPKLPCDNRGSYFGNNDRWFSIYEITSEMLQDFLLK